MTTTTTTTTNTAPLLDMLLDDVRQYADQWAAQKSSSGTVTTLKTGVAFMLDAMDDFINTVDSDTASGADKKAAVEQALTTLYVDVITPLLPLWLKPFESGIQAFVFDSVVDPLIDYVVSLYHSPSTTSPTTVPAATN